MSILPYLYIVGCLHLEGKWGVGERYRFLTKFGFQRTQSDELEATRGYIYGSINSANEDTKGGNFSELATLVVVDGEFILDLYGNATGPGWLLNSANISQSHAEWQLETARCRLMFSHINNLAYHRSCSPTGQMDLLRSVPCPKWGLCHEEDDPNRVLPGSQFTYAVQDLRQPRFWYLSLVACIRNPQSCEWETTSVSHPRNFKVSSPKTINYSIWLVNGDPKLQGFNQFQHQFSFELHNTAEMFFVFLTLYVVLLVIAHIKLISHSSPHTILFLVHLWFASLGTLLTAIHLGVFAFDGRGLGLLSEVGILISQWADALFLVLLISTAEMGFNAGYRSSNVIAHSIPTSDTVIPYLKLRNHSLMHAEQVNQSGHPSNDGLNSSAKTPPCWPYIVCLTVVFIGIKTCLFVWALVDRDPVTDFTMWNTVPGGLLLALRLCTGFWFFILILKNYHHRTLAVNKALTNRSRMEHNIDPYVDVIRFTAGFLLWIIVLPLVVFVGEAFVSPLWRNKAILSVCFSADYVAATVYGYLFWCSNHVFVDKSAHGPY